jgi:transposase
MNEDSVVYVGVDAAKAKHAIAIAESGRSGEVRYVGEIETTPAAVERFVRKLARKHPRLHFGYEAGPTGYGLHRQLVSLGHACEVVAPSLIPKRPGEHVKTNRRDAISLARLLRAGELKGIWVPDAVHEAVRDLVRAREAAGEDLRKKRQQLQSFLLRHGRTFTGHKAWSPAHSRWLAAQRFEHPAQQIVFQDQVDVIADAGQRLERLDAHLVELVPTWSMAPVVAAYQALRGVSFIVAVTFVSEVGDVRRFDSPRQLMAFLGLVPSERSTGESVKRGGLTLAGNRRARRVLVEGAWSYRHPARVTETIRARLEGLPKAVREIAWKAQTRLCARYRRMTAAGKKAPIVIAAIAREMAAFWQRSCGPSVDRSSRSGE